MIPQSQANIFLSVERLLSETDKYRSYSSMQRINSFGNLSSFEEITLAEAATTTLLKSEKVLCVIIPLVGTVHFENSQDDGLLNPGQALFCSEETIITNPYTDALVNFLQLRFVHTSESPNTITCFDIDNQKNTFIGISESSGLPQLSIGKFDGRSEVLHKLQSKDNGFFVHVITGAFEVQYRLLEAKDSITVWDTDTLDLEALSNEAIILLVETPLAAQEV